MPLLNISTSVPLEGLNTSDILLKTSKSVAKIIGRPEAYVIIQLKGSIAILFEGTEQPVTYGELVSIGGLGSDTNKKLRAAIATMLET